MLPITLRMQHDHTITRHCNVLRENVTGNHYYTHYGWPVVGRMFGRRLASHIPAVISICVVCPALMTHAETTLILRARRK